MAEENDKRGGGAVAQFPDDTALQERMGRIGHKIIVLSGKGGVGKSTVAANLAVALARAGKKVGLLDVDIHGPSIPRLLGLEGQSLQAQGETIIPLTVGDNLKVMSIGFLLHQDDAVIWRGPLKMKVIRQFLDSVEWGELDFLVIDSPPGTGDEPLSVAQLIENPTGAIVVTTPQELSIIDVRKCISFCRQLNLPVLGVIENMSGFVCPRCGEVTNIFKAGGGKSMAEEMDVPFLGQIPIEPEIVEAGDAGMSYIEQFDKAPTAKVFAEVIKPILEIGMEEDKR